MPMYSLVVRTDGGEASKQNVGFFNDAGALGYAKKSAFAASVEVWRGSNLIAEVQDQRALGGSSVVPNS